MRTRLLLLSLLSAATLAFPVAAHAQPNQNTVTISPALLTLPTPAIADFITGYVENLSGFTYVVDATKGSPTAGHSFTVDVYTTVSTLGGAVPSSSLKIKRQSQAPTSYATIPCCSLASAYRLDAFVIYKGGANDPYTGVASIRFTLSETVDPPGTYTTGATGLVFVFTQTVI